MTTGKAGAFPRNGVKNRVVVISGPSGSGKTTVISELLKNKKLGMQRLITCTSRPPREGERDGIDYIFWDKERFKKAIKDGDLLEHEIIHGNYYGSPMAQLRGLLEKAGVLVSLGIQGAFAVRKLNVPSTLIFLKAPSMAELKKRILTRKIRGEELKTRLKNAQDVLTFEKDFDFSVVNDDLKRCISAIEKYLRKS